MTSKQKTWPQGTISRMPFAVNIIQNLSNKYYAGIF